MAKLTFRGGITPPDGKNLTKNAEIRTLLPIGSEMVYPLRQHIGSAAVPVVKPGDHVLAGQKIASADGTVSADLHSAVSGTVASIEERTSAAGEKLNSIVIESDGLWKEISYPEDRQPEELTKDVILQAVKDAGIVGLGGSGLPSHYKLSEAFRGSIDMVIANCVECEPYITSNARRILENPWKLIGGLAVLLKLYPGARGFIAVSEDNTEGYRLLRELLSGSSAVYVKKVRGKYPAGSERQLIYALTGRTLNARMIPYDIGCLMHNADTLIAINQAVIMHEPLITRVLTVSGDAAAHPGNYRVPIGMSYQDVLKQAGGLKQGLTKDDVLFLDGGPMSGRVIRELDAPVTKLSRGLTCFTAEHLWSGKETGCTRCGKCMSACPNLLVPFQFLRDIRKKDNSVFVRHGGMECSGCGCCSYVCPSGIPVSARIWEHKKEVISSGSAADEYKRRYVRW